VPESKIKARILDQRTLLDPIDAIKIQFEPGQLFLLNICLAFIMFGIALDLKVDDFKRLLRNPKPAAVGLSSQLILLPLLTFGLVNVWPMPLSMAMGLIMVASCPGGNISNFNVHFGKGNTALSITLTSFVTLFAILTTPITFGFWTGLLPGTSELMQGISVNPVSMFSTIGKLILIPLIAGMAIHRYLPKVSAVIRKPIQTASLVIFLAIILVALYENRNELHIYLEIVFLVVLVHNGLALLLGYYYAKAWKLPLADVKAISMETGIQNSGLGLVLIFNFFEGLGGMLLVAAWWGIWDMVSGILLSGYWRYRATATTKKSSLKSG
jgi:BASS family bile acid:Na+ symporter